MSEQCLIVVKFTTPHQIPGPLRKKCLFIDLHKLKLTISYFPTKIIPHLKSSPLFSPRMKQLHLWHPSFAALFVSLIDICCIIKFSL